MSDLRSFAEAAIGIAIGRTLSVECGRCTKQAHFVGMRRAELMIKVRNAGWRVFNGKELCPECLNEKVYTNDLIHLLATQVINQANL